MIVNRSPIVKMGEEKVVKEYKKITLMATGYKVYMAVLAKIRKKVSKRK